MADSTVLVCGSYRTEAALERAKTYMQVAGFLDANFSVLAPQGAGVESRDEGDLADFAASDDQFGAARSDAADPASLSVPPLQPASAPGGATPSLRESSPAGILDLVARVLHKGKMLLSVRCDGPEQALLARRIFERTAAETIASSADAIARADSPPPAPGFLC